MACGGRRHVGERFGGASGGPADSKWTGVGGLVGQGRGPVAAGQSMVLAKIKYERLGEIGPITEDTQDCNFSAQ